MIRSLTVCSVSLLLIAAACSSDASSGAEADITTTSVAGVATTDAGALTTTTAAASTTIPAATTAPTPAPTTEPPPPPAVRCRAVGSLFALTDLTGVDVRQGDCGDGVKEVQEQLNYKLSIALVADGLFGPATDAAVRDFQLSVGLPVTGIVDISTWIALTDDGT